MRVAFKAERHRRRVAPTRDAYGAEAATAASGSRSVGEALISATTNGSATCREWFDPRPMILLVRCTLFPLLTVTWSHEGVSLSGHPASPYGAWLDHLRWGLDSACSAMRFLAMGNAIGAATIARTQLERWSDHLPRSSGGEREPSESTSDWYTRLWSRTDEQREVYEQVWGARPLSRRPAGTTWSELSELLHGRGPLMASVHWEASLLTDPLQADLHHAASRTDRHAEVATSASATFAAALLHMPTTAGAPGRTA